MDWVQGGGKARGIRPGLTSVRAEASDSWICACTAAMNVCIMLALWTVLAVDDVASCQRVS
jgi:hypothetical protein